jgi:hypothetical protein
MASLVTTECKYDYTYLVLAVAQLVEALTYKPEGRGFNSRSCHWVFF